MTTARAWSAPKLAPLMLPMPVIRPSRLRRPVCAAIASAPYSMKLPASHRSAMFWRALRPPWAWRRAMASGRAGAAGVGGNGWCAVFDEAAGVAQVGDVLARAAPALGLAPGHGFGAGGVERGGMAFEHLLQVGA